VSAPDISTRGENSRPIPKSPTRHQSRKIKNPPERGRPARSTISVPKNITETFRVGSVSTQDGFFKKKRELLPCQGNLVQDQLRKISLGRGPIRYNSGPRENEMETRFFGSLSGGDRLNGLEQRYAQLRATEATRSP